MFKKIALLILILILAIGVVSANDELNDTLTTDLNETAVEIDNGDELAANNNSEDILADDYDEEYYEDDDEYKVNLDVDPFTVDLNSKKWFEVYVTDYWGDPVDEGYIKFNWNGHNYKLDVQDGVAVSYIYAAHKITTQTVTIKYVDDSNYYYPASVKTTFKTVKANTFIRSLKSYQYNENYYQFWLASKDNGAGVSNVKLKIKIKIGKKYKTYYKRTGGSGHLVLHIKGLSVGKHKVIITSLNKNVKLKTYKSNIVVKKAKINIRTSSSGKYIKIKAKDRYGDVAKNIKIKVKLYTGKHYKTVVVKTNKKGMAKVYVGGLSSNVYHKVKYSSGNKNYYIRDSDGNNLDYVYLSSGKALPLWWLP